jgi:hypothetical protein
MSNDPDKYAEGSFVKPGELKARSERSMTQTATRGIAALRAAISGSVFVPTDGGYDNPNPR